MNAPVRDPKGDAPVWDLLDGFFHDIRSPLAAARGAVQLLRRNDAATEARREALMEAVSSCVERITEKVQAVEVYRDLARTDGVETAETVDLADLLADVVLAYDTSGRELVVSLAPVSVVGDRVAIRNALEALVDNACTHTPFGTRVDVSLASSDGGALVVVADDGSGVPYDVRERVFAPLDRGDAPRSVVGLGLGLAVVVEVARLHGGRTWVEGTAGGGATFRLLLRDADDGALRGSRGR